MNDSKSPTHLAISSNGTRSGGGLFQLCLTTHAVDRIDTLSTTGLFEHDGRIARMLQFHEDDHGGELIEYDERGVCRYLRLDELNETHDVIRLDDCYVIVSTGTNSVHWVNLDGSTRDVWHAEGSGDAWHLNCLHRRGDQLYATAFGMFANHRDWKPNLGSRCGVLLSIPDGKIVASGLDGPHTPRSIDQNWLICDSATGRLIELNPQGELVREVDLGGWTRGLCQVDDKLYVGVSGRRGKTIDEGNDSTIAVVSAVDFKLLDRITIPIDEVYDLCPVNEQLLDGLRRGFHTNELRVREQQRHEMLISSGVDSRSLWPSGEEIAFEDMRVNVVTDFPSGCDIDGNFVARVTLTNTGSRSYVSVLPFPVHLGYRWETVDGQITHEGRMRLPGVLDPSDSVTVDLMVNGQDRGDAVRIHISLVQEGVNWFDRAVPESGRMIPLFELENLSKVT